MFRTSHSVTTLASLDEIWGLVKDVAEWHKWLLGIEAVQLHGPLATGVSGLMHQGGGMVNQVHVQKFDMGHLEITVDLSFGVKMNLRIVVSREEQWSRVKLEGELRGKMALLHVFGAGKDLRTGLVPATRRLGALAQGQNI